MAGEWTAEYKHTDPELVSRISPAKMSGTTIDRDTVSRLVAALYSCPHGVLAMSKDIPGLVETSTNLASVKMDREQRSIRVGSSQRSAINSARKNAAQRIESLFLLAGARVSHEGEYPGWAPNPDSPILRISEQAYQDLPNTPVKVRAIHAGLNVYFPDAYPCLDMTSFGPTLRGARPTERLDIASTAKFWDFLAEILKRV